MSLVEWERRFEVSTKNGVKLNSVGVMVMLYGHKVFTSCIKLFPWVLIKTKGANSPDSAIVLSNRTDMPKGA